MRIRILSSIALAVSTFGFAPRAQAQYGGGGNGGSVLLQGIVDGEFWSTNATSSLLTRNSGKPAGLVRGQLWGAYQPTNSLVFYAQGEVEAGPARLEQGAEAYADQLGARYIVSPALSIDAGRFTPIIGTFASRHFSTRNPLIGEPDGYTADYPIGAKISGEAAHFDYRFAMVSLPTTHALYEPDPTPRLRPAIGGGYTPFVGLRLGASFTHGSYLNRDTPAAALNGRAWSDYNQTVAAADVEFSRGYLDTHFEAARGSYEVPGQASNIVGFTYYGEARYTITPRLFVAARVERNDYPFIHEGNGSGWTARLTDFVDGEGGLGYRVTASSIVKATFRSDRWWSHSYPDGQAFAMQWSQAFDVMDWVDRVKGY
ncbi:MAG TPA: hypothetical protein VN706_18775 [Gemmatimonadaceae bacterium]|nr:hypothetical protein [Gemmatimonadaceae bacterium]